MGKTGLYAGRYSQDAGIKISSFEKDDHVRLEEDKFNNGLILELWGFMKMRHIPEDIFLKLLVGIAPASSNLASISRATLLQSVKAIHIHRDWLRRNRRSKEEFKDLESRVFVVSLESDSCHEVPVELPSVSSPVLMPSQMDPVLLDDDYPADDPMLADLHVPAALGHDASFLNPRSPDVADSPAALPGADALIDDLLDDYGYEYDGSLFNIGFDDDTSLIDADPTVADSALLTPDRRIPLPDDLKEVNTLSYTVSFQEKKLDKVTSELSSQSDALKEQENKNVARLRAEKQQKLEHLKTKIAHTEQELESKNVKYYLKKNVDLRESSKKKTISNLRKKVKTLKKDKKSAVREVEKQLAQKNEQLVAKDNEIVQLMNTEHKEIDKLKETLAKLEQELDDSVKQKRQVEKMKSYYKNLPANSKKKKGKVSRDYENLNSYVKVLENRLLNVKDNQNSSAVLIKDDNGFRDEVRLGVLELLGLEVAIHKVSPVIQAVAKHFFGHTFSEKDLPSRQTVLRMSDEGQFLIKHLYGHKLSISSHYGVNKDGTSRKKVKLLETSITLDSGEALPLGFRRIAKEDAQTVSDNTWLELSEICDTAQDCDLFKVEALSKLSFLMQDRAATEKKANEIFTAWVQEELKKADAPATKIHALYCMAHVLLGLHRYSTEDLKKLQAELVAEGGKLGRDANGAYFHFKSELAVTRIVRMLSELLGPNVDEQCGIRDKWLAELELRHERSLIGDYKDNRFNGLFEVASQVMVHIDDILGLEKRLKTPINLKVRSIFFDLKDSRVVTMVQAQAILYVKITEPYWRLVTSKDVPYLTLHEYIKPLLHNLEIYTADPASLLEDDELIPRFPSTPDTVFYTAALNIRHPDRMDLLLRVISCSMGAFARCIRKQLSDILEGQYSEPASAADLERTSGSGLTNLTSERNFGSLDASQKRRRHATLHFHSSVLLLKSNRNRLVSWLLSKPKKERKALMTRARKHGKLLRLKHMREEKIQKEKEQADLQEVEAEAKRKAAKKLLRQAKLASAKTKAKKKATAVPSRGKSKTKATAVPSRIKTSKSKAKGSKLPPAPEVVATVTVDDWVAVAFENGVWYPGRVISLDKLDSPMVQYMHPASTRTLYKYPAQLDQEEVELKFIFRKLEAPFPVAGGRFYKLQNIDTIDNDYKLYKQHYFN